MQTYELIVSGRVQGVGYRNYVQKLAKKFNVNGTVKNLYSGDVRIIAQTKETVIDQFINNIQKPQHSLMKIENVKKTKLDTSEVYNNFTVEY